MSAGREDKSTGGSASELLAVARLYGPHGLRGEVRASVLAPDVVDFPSLVMGERPLYLRREGALLGCARVTQIRGHVDSLLITFEGYEDRTAAEGLKNAELCMARADLPELPEGWYWEDDIIGAEVEDARRGRIGKSEGLENAAGRWLLAVCLDRGGRIQVPWTKPLIVEVNVESRAIKIDLPLDYPGLD